MKWGDVNYVSGVAGGLLPYAARFQKVYPVVYVDCCNRFDPYGLYQLTRDEMSLERVWIARPFTIYQLRELVFEKLEKIIQKLQNPVLLISSIDYYRVKTPLEEDEHRTIEERVMEQVKALTRDYQLLTYISRRGV